MQGKFLNEQGSFRSMQDAGDVCSSARGGNLLQNAIAFKVGFGWRVLLISLRNFGSLVLAQRLRVRDSLRRGNGARQPPAGLPLALVTTAAFLP